MPRRKRAEVAFSAFFVVIFVSLRSRHSIESVKWLRMSSRPFEAFFKALCDSSNVFNFDLMPRTRRRRRSATPSPEATRKKAPSSSTSQNAPEADSTSNFEAKRPRLDLSVVNGNVEDEPSVSSSGNFVRRSRSHHQHQHQQQQQQHQQYYSSSSRTTSTSSRQQQQQHHNYSRNVSHNILSNPVQGASLSSSVISIYGVPHWAALYAAYTGCLIEQLCMQHIQGVSLL